MKEILFEKKAIREIIITVLLALLFFLVIRSVAHASVVNGISMEPNLHTGQRIIVIKAHYWFGDPKRGDIVVFDTPRHDHDVIHRVVGLPGELVEIKKGEVFINGQKLEEPYAHGDSVSSPLQEIPDKCYLIIGDNRNASTVDIVPSGDIIGRAWVCYWPISKLGRVPNHSW